MNDWADVYRAYNPEVANQLNEDRNVSFDNLKKLDLPRYFSVKLDYLDFLEEPERFVENHQSKTYYVAMLPKVKESGMERHSRVDVALEDIEKFVHQRICPTLHRDYDIVVNEFWENLYGGNIIVNEDGKLVIEFKKGLQMPIAKETKKPDYIVWRDEFTNSFKYSFDNFELKEVVYRTINSIPHSGEGRDVKYTPGYYEFTLVKKSETSLLEPIFFDCRLNSAYELK